MNRILIIIGLTVTALYSIGIYILIKEQIGQLLKMPLNEVGVFLAGVFGPLVIFWLILGFFQQGKELQQSTKALELQAAELNNSVQQQKELVEVSKKQVEAELEALRYEHKKQTDLAKPIFAFSPVRNTHDGSTKSTFDIKVTNVGGTITQMKFPKTGNEFKLNDIQSWETNREIRLKWVYIKNMPKEEYFQIQFTDRLGNVGEERYKIVVNNQNTPPTAEILLTKL